MSTTFVDGTTPLNAANMNALQQKVEKGQANGYASLDGTTKVPVAQIPLTVVSYGTTLPASPVDGQEAILVDSVTSPSYTWRFRYNAGGGTYKWEFVGGAPMTMAVDASQSTASATLVDLATVGPSLTVPRAGIYSVQASCGLAQGAGGPTYSAGFQVINTDIVANTMLNGAGAGWAGSAFGLSYSATVTAGTTFKMQYFTASAVATSFDHRRLWVWPRLVS
jgi:hypothetical protein